MRATHLHKSLAPRCVSAAPRGCLFRTVLGQPVLPMTWLVIVGCPPAELVQWGFCGRGARAANEQRRYGSAPSCRLLFGAGGAQAPALAATAHHLRVSPLTRPLHLFHRSPTA